MVSSVRAIPLAAIFLVAFLTGIPGDSTTTPVIAQDGDVTEELQHFRGWSIGDNWHYTKEATGANPAKTRGTVVFWVQSAERVTNTRFFDEETHPESWRSHQVFRVKVWANQTANSGYGPAVIETEQERYHRTKDLALAQMHATSSFTFINSPANDGGMERYHELYPPQVEFEFPFGIGDKWRAASLMRNHNPGDDCGGENRPPCDTITNKVNTYSVVAKETLRMTLNGEVQDVETWRILVVDELGIESTDDVDAKQYQIWWYSPEVCNVVKKEEYSAKRTRQMVWTLTDYSCKGRDGPDPSYDIYDFQNLSSLRRHGELAIPKALADLNKFKDADGQKIGGGLIHLAERAPAPAPLVLIGTLVALAAAIRRQDR